LPPKCRIWPVLAKWRRETRALRAVPGCRLRQEEAQMKAKKINAMIA
jgi:hypothetical protein